MVLRRFALPTVLSLCYCLTACGPNLRDGVAQAYAALPEEIDFNFHVKPILSDRCYACHGPDAQNQQADLRLDNAAGAYAALSSGNGYAIVAGYPERSEAITRINSEDTGLVMPPPESNLSLSDREVAILTKWVEEGAEYKEHWAFTPPVKPAVPAAGGTWATNEVDRFVAAKLEAENVEPSPEAEREFLIRRYFFDLTGLPPTSAEIDHWLAEPQSDWYEKLVDELLDRPAYGERMATYWLDVARFADTEGYLDDLHHELWPYRDWVIKAYNANLPHNDFIEWQIGGDQFPGATREQVLATTFNRNHKQNAEGGIIAEEFRVEYVADRANTTGTAFMGLTVGCARCHDHKYDPFSQKNYYQLFGFFNQTVERGDAIFALNGVENGRRVANKLSMNSGPTLPLPNAETERIYDHLQKMIREEEERLASLKSSSAASRDRAKFVSATPPDNAAVSRRIAARTAAFLTFDGPHKDHATNENILFNNLKTMPGAHGQALRLGEGAYVVNGDRTRFERSEPFTVSFWVRAEKMHADALMFYNSNGKNQGMRGWETRLDSNRLVVKLSHAYPYQSLALLVPDPLTINEWTHFVWSYDGSSKAAGMKIYRDGVCLDPEVLRDHLIRSTVPYTERDPLLYEVYSGLVIGSRNYDPGFTDGGIDELRILNVEAGDLMAQQLYCSGDGRGRGCKEKPPETAVTEYRQLHRSRTHELVRERLTALRTRAVETIDTVREVMVMGDGAKLRPTYILNRGVYDDHGTRISAGVPENLLEWPDGLPNNRYGLAKWLTHKDNPLTARVAVNQLWYLMFGRGIVETVEDFGNQGSLPSHPELLDWLAVDFRENDWEVKRLIRKLVTSSTYRQSSAIREDLQEADPANYWLARAPRYRRSAEMVRDNALAVSGLLDRKIGGASVFPYQPPGLWSEVGHHPFSPKYVVDSTGGGMYRRSLYSFWKRNAPGPAMLVFDASLRSECQVRRQRSNTPLQALVLLNDPQTLEACRVLAANSLTENDDPSRAARLVFRALTGRTPTPSEYLVLTQYFEDELSYFHDHPVATQDFLRTGYHATDVAAGEAKIAALARVASLVMNSTEGYYKN